MKALRILLLIEPEAEGSLLKERFQRAGHDVVAARDSLTALEATVNSPFDVCVIGSGIQEVDAQEFLDALREFEAGQRDSEPAAVLIAAKSSEPLARLTGMDATLAPDFSEEEFAAALRVVQSREELAKNAAVDAGYESLTVFEPEAFKDQCVGDPDLMVEIIDLFSEEQNQEIDEMREALAAGELDRLYRLAHTLKGSLATLHAPRARQCALDLEMAARFGNASGSVKAFTALETELSPLSSALKAFRQQILRP